MPFYQRLGDLPRKRHIQFRENGTLLTEEVMGLEGFSGNESILYHLHSPCRVSEVASFEPIVREEWVPDGHAHRHLRPRHPQHAGNDLHDGAIRDAGAGKGVGDGIPRGHRGGQRPADEGHEADWHADHERDEPDQRGEAPHDVVR